MGRDLDSVNFPQLKDCGLIEAAGFAIKKFAEFDFPQLKDCGLIEASLREPLVLSALIFPQLKDCGLIEASESIIRTRRSVAHHAGARIEMSADS